MLKVYFNWKQTHVEHLMIMMSFRIHHLRKCYHHHQKTGHPVHPQPTELRQFQNPIQVGAMIIKNLIPARVTFPNPSACLHGQDR